MQHRQFSVNFLVSIIILLHSLTSALTIDCSNVRVEGQSFNFDSLDGPHSVGWDKEHEDNIRLFTFTINICNYLKKDINAPKDEDCPNSSNICGVERALNKHENGTKPMILNVIPIAGNYIHNGAPLDPKWTRLKSSTSHSDREKEGVRLEVHGMKHDGLKQKAVIEFLCDANKEEQGRGLPSLGPRNEKDDVNANPHFKQEEGDGDGGRIKFQGYDVSDDTRILSLEWITKNACEDAADAPKKGSSSNHWGFFTWLIIIIFLATAAYLIFGSWLNYNRYSARGWDLVPHSETIRDLPYLLRDWVRRVVNTVSGGGSRGGYSAV